MPNKEWPHHGIPAYIDLDDKRGRVFGTVFPDILQEQLPENCYAVFLDPANAIIVRSRQCSDGELSAPNRILCTTDLSPNFRKSPRDHIIVWLDGDRVIQVDRANYQKIVDSHQGPTTLVAESSHVVRLGVGSFFEDKSLDNDFETKSIPNPPKSKPVRPDGNNATLSGTVRIDGKEKQIAFNPEDVKKVTGDQSWGVITKDDTRVPVSIR
mgnify:CR=1 FL=1